MLEIIYERVFVSVNFENRLIIMNEKARIEECLNCMKEKFIFLLISMHGRCFFTV